MSAAVDRRRLRRNFSTSAASYDRHAQIQQQVVAGLLELMAGHGPQQGRFLDIGCGTGGLACEVARQRPQMQPTLSDIAHGMTRQAARRLPSAAAVDGAAETLPFADCSIDLICSASVYQWVADLPQAFAENARILKDGGLFAFALFGGETLRELKTAYRQAAAALGEGAGHLHQLPELVVVRQALALAGFQQLELQRQELIEYHREVADLLRSLKGIGAGNASPQAPRGLASRRLLQSMSDIYRQRYGRAGRVPATYEVFYGLAVRPQRREELGGLRGPAE